MSDHHDPSDAAGEPSTDGIADGAVVEDDWEVLDDADDEWGRVLDDGYDDYVRVPRTRSGRTLVLMVLGGLASLVAVLLLFGWFWWSRQVDPPGDPGAEVTVEVAEGATVTDVANQLEEGAIISNAMVFRLYSRLNDFSEVQAGQYDELYENSAMGDVIERLERGPAAPPPAAFVTVPEGLTRDEILARINNAMPEMNGNELRAAVAAIETSYRPSGISSAEGLLFPDTYRVETGDEADEAKLVAQMVTRLETVLGELGYDELSPRDAYDLIIIASMIEEEAKVPADQAKISRVIHNRLEAGTPLGIDATLLYAIGHTDDPTQSQLETDSPYNTRLYAGLPPTPIAIPGRGALEAALHPADGPWVFYVLANEDDEHFFTDSYDEFLRVRAEACAAELFPC